MHDVDAEHHAAHPVGLVVHLTAAERREVPVVPKAEVELVSEHGRDGPLLRHPGEGMRERCEDVDLHEEKLVGLGETTRHQMRRRSRSTSRTHCETSGSAWPVSSSRTSFATPGARPARRRAGGLLLLHLDTDELEDVVAALLRRRKLIPRDSEDRAALDRAVESDDHPAAGPFEATTAAASSPPSRARPPRSAQGRRSRPPRRRSRRGRADGPRGRP